MVAGADPRLFPWRCGRASADAPLLSDQSDTIAGVPSRSLAWPRHSTMWGPQSLTSRYPPTTRYLHQGRPVAGTVWYRGVVLYECVSGDTTCSGSEALQIRVGALGFDSDQERSLSQVSNKGRVCAGKRFVSLSRNASTVKRNIGDELFMPNIPYSWSVMHTLDDHNYGCTLYGPGTESSANKVGAFYANAAYKPARIRGLASWPSQLALPICKAWSTTASTGETTAFQAVAPKISSESTVATLTHLVVTITTVQAHHHLPPAFAGLQ